MTKRHLADSEDPLREEDDATVQVALAAAFPAHGRNVTWYIPTEDEISKRDLVKREGTTYRTISVISPITGQPITLMLSMMAVWTPSNLGIWELG